MTANPILDAVLGDGRVRRQISRLCMSLEDAVCTPRALTLNGVTYTALPTDLALSEGTGRAARHMGSDGDRGEIPDEEAAGGVADASDWEPVRRVLTRMVYYSVYARRFNGRWEAPRVYRHGEGSRGRSEVHDGDPRDAPLHRSEGWHVENIRPDGRVDVRQLGRRLRVSGGAVLAPGGLQRALRPGDEVSLAWQACSHDARGVHWRYSRAPATADAGSLARIYINSPLGMRARMLELCVDALDRYGVAGWGKAFLHDGPDPRRDNVVLYLPHDQLVAAAQPLREALGAANTPPSHDLPLLSLPLRCAVTRRALAVAPSPVDGESFGVVVSRTLARSAVLSLKAGHAPDPDALVDGLMTVWAADAIRAFIDMPRFVAGFERVPAPGSGTEPDAEPRPHSDALGDAVNSGPSPDAQPSRQRGTSVDTGEGRPGGVAPTGGIPTESFADTCLNAARGIRTTLLSHRLPDGPGGFWMDGHFERTGVMFRACDASVAEGHAGIGLFLAEMAQIGPDPEAAEAAEEALQRALDESGELAASNATSLLTGRLGVFWAARDGFQSLGQPERARAVTRQWSDWLEDHLSRDAEGDGPPGLDLYQGDAGGVLAVCDVLEHAPELAATFRPHLAKLAQRLLDGAQPSKEGLSWPTFGHGLTRNLLGMAHGAAGVGLALYAAANVLEAQHLAAAAQQAFAFERAHFARGDWPDFRYEKRANMPGSSGTTDMPDDAASSGEPETADSNQEGWTGHGGMWCHGHPGGLLARWEALRHAPPEDQDALRADIDAARATFAARLASDCQTVLSDASLCHGRYSRFWIAQLGLCDEALMHDIRTRIANDCRDRGAGAHWPGGKVPDARSPSALLGLSGTGLALLHFAEVAPPNPLSHRTYARPPVSMRQAGDGI